MSIGSIFGFGGNKKVKKVNNRFNKKTEEEPEVLEDDDAIVKERRFQKQCFLIENMEKFHGFNRKHLYDKLAIINGEPSVITNELTKRPGVERLFEISPAQLSLLVPTLRIFKVEYADENDRVGVDRELKFDSYLSRSSVDAITASGRGRPNSVGIEKFTWDYFGKNPAEATTNIKASLSIFIQNIESLGLQDESGDSDVEGTLDSDNSTVQGEARITDLFIFSKREIQEGKGCKSKRTYNPKHFRIKAIVGWAVPPKNDLIDPELMQVIGSLQTVLMLDLTRHSLDFREDGTLTLTADYIGSVESSINHPSTDILNIGEDLKEREQELSDRKNRSKCKEDPNVEDPDIKGDRDEKDIEEERGEIEGLRSKDRIKKYRRLLQTIKDTKRIFFVDVPRSSLGITESGDQIAREKPKKDDTSEEEEKKSKEDPPEEDKGPDIEPQKAETAEPIDKALEEGAKEQAEEEPSVEEAREEIIENLDNEILNETSKRVNKNNIRINFIYFGDIMNSVLEVLDARGSAVPENTRLLMGPMIFHDNRGDKGSNTQKRMVNLADIPISLELFTHWWTSKVLKPGGITNYFLKQFIRDAIQDLIFASIKGGCNRSSLSQSTLMGLNVIVTKGKGPRGSKPRIENGTRVTVDDISDNQQAPLPPGAERKTNQGLHHYIFIFSSAEAADMFQGNREEDFRRGIYHLGIGEERGLLRSVKFSQVGQKYQKEANYERDGADVENFFRERYNAKVELFGNVLFYPGSQVYINPSVVGLGNPKSRNSLVRRLGIGGYYIIKGVSNSISSAGFQTTLDCVHENRGEGTEKTPRELPADGANGFLGTVAESLGIGGDGKGKQKSVDSPILGGLGFPGASEG